MSQNNKIREFKGTSLFNIIYPNNYIVIDIETTGLSSSKNELIEIAALKVENNNIIDTFEVLIKPNLPISSFISNLTGITNEMLENALSSADALTKFITFISNNILVGHNIHFDINFLYDKCMSDINHLLTNDFIDTLRIARKISFDSVNYKLSTICNCLGIKNETAHRALSDCKATHECFQTFKNIPIKPSDISNYLSLLKENDTQHLLYQKKCLVSSYLKHFEKRDIKEMFSKIGIIFQPYYTKKTDYFILSEDEIKDNKSNYGYETEKIISEYDFYNMCQFNIIKLTPSKKTFEDENISSQVQFDKSNPFYQKECVFTGALTISRNELINLVVSVGGFGKNYLTKATNYLVVGSFEFETRLKGTKSSKMIKAEKYISEGIDLKIISEEVFFKLLNNTISTDEKSDCLLNIKAT